MKNRLIRYQKDKTEIEYLKNEIAALKDDLYGGQATKITGMPRGSDISNPTHNQSEKNVKTKKLIREKIKRHNQLVKSCNEVVLFLNKVKMNLSSNEYNVLKLKYIDGHKNENICKYLKINSKSLDNKRYNGLKKVKRYWDEKEC